MKTAEEILESHLTSMLSRTKDSYVTIDEMKQVPEWKACVNAIEQAQIEAYNQAIDDAVMNAEAKVEVWYDFDARAYQRGDVIVDKDSILKLKK